MKGGARDYWFVLTPKTLSWYTDEQEKDQKLMILLDNLRIKDLESGYITSRRHMFGIYNSNRTNVCKDWKSLDLSCESQDDFESWKNGFMVAGVYPDNPGANLQQQSHNNADHYKEPTESSMDPQLQRQVKTIRSLVDSYMKIVIKTCKDLVPKKIMHLIINDVEQFINSDLVVRLLSTGETDVMMEESAEETQKRNEKLKLYHACREAVEIIRSVASAGITIPTNPVKELAKSASTNIYTTDGAKHHDSMDSFNTNEDLLPPTIVKEVVVESTSSGVKNFDFEPSPFNTNEDILPPPPPTMLMHTSTNNEPTPNSESNSLAPLTPTRIAPPPMITAGHSTQVNEDHLLPPPPPPSNTDSSILAPNRVAPPTPFRSAPPLPPRGRTISKA